MKGLTEKEVLENREKYGSNILTEGKKNSFLKLLICSLGDPIIKILLIALAIKTIFLFKNFDWFETIGIVIAIFLASFISTISEYGSEKAFKKLQEEASKIKCRVKRNNNLKEISVEEVVVNDLIFLEPGSAIPADGKVIEGSITVDESLINGETKESKKIIGSKLFKGTVVYSNQCIMKVTEVGDKTFYGNIAKELQEKEPMSPLKLRLLNLAKIISKIGYVGAILVSLSYLFSVIVLANNFDATQILETVTNPGLMSGHILYALTLSVTVIIVAVPEGLPMMITLVLSSNMKRMLKSNVLVRKLVGIETSGNLNILFTDKTGTLTNGKLKAVKFVSSELKEYSNIDDIKTPLKEMVETSLIYNTASTYNEKQSIGGNITDKCLKEFVKKNKLDTVKIVSSIPFDSAYKFSSVCINNINLIKGAQEKTLPFCSFYYDANKAKKDLKNKNEIINKIKFFEQQGCRIIVLATSDYEMTKFNNLALVGFIVIKDEVRPNVKDAIELVKQADIQTIMITGDNKDTAISISKETGLLELNDIVLTSNELQKMSDYEIAEKLSKIKIIARALPQDKSRLVRIAQSLDLVVGMTGDGVNDAPALKKADVGFAMGSGTEVSKEASDIIILDDNFASITKAILFGRTIFKSIRKFIVVQLSINLCALTLSIVGPFIGIGTPITVIQMLWINMIMDTLAGLAFAFEPPLREYMYEKSKKKNELIINKYMVNEILWTGVYSAIICILFLKLPLIRNVFESEKDLYTAFFGLFIFIDIFNSFNARTHRLNILANISKNKIFIGIIVLIVTVQIILIYYGGDLFRTYGLSQKELIVMLLISFSVIPFDWIRKTIFRIRNGKIGV